MSKKIFIILFSFTLALAFVLRFWHLGSTPSGLDWDEASLGYNAYSILQTGKDEYGTFLPIVLRSFDDYKPVLYTYLSIPFIAIFGLTEFAVRFPSALIGVVTVFATYFFIKELMSMFYVGLKNENLYAKYLPLLVSFFLAISPWHIQFSRVAFEASVGMSFNIFSSLFFLKGLRKPWFLFLSTIFLALNMYVYQSEKVFSPLLFFALIFIFRKNLQKISRKYLIVSVVVGLIILLPFVRTTLTSRDTLARAKGVSILSGKTSFLERNVLKLNWDKEMNDVAGLILDNRRIAYGNAIIAGYLSHFDLNWLFISGDYNANRHHAPNMGLLYIFELPLLIIGFYQLLFSDLDKRAKILIYSWFFIAPVPAAATIDIPHAVRTLNFLPMFQIFTACGVIYVFNSLFTYKFKILLFLLAILFFVINFSYFFNQYFVQQDYLNSADWQYGYKDLISYVKPIQKNYAKIIVSDTMDFDQSYMFFLFYLKYDPKKYINEGGSNARLLFGGKKFSNFEFRKFDYQNEKQKNVLFVGSPEDFPVSYKAIKIVNYLDGKLGRIIAEVE